MKMRMQLILTVLMLCLALQPMKAQLDGIGLGAANEIVETSGEIELLDASEARYSERQRITILNAESRANFFYVYYDDDNKILNLDVDIFDINGEPVRKVRKSEIRDEAAIGGGSIYTEQRVKYIELNHAEYPYVVEFNYTQRLRGIRLASMPNWYFQDRNTSAVQKSTFTVTVPDELSIQYQLYNLELDPQVSKSKGKTVYKWEASNIAAFENEPYTVASGQQLPLLRLTPSRFQVDDYAGSMESWDAYGQFMHELWDGRDEIAPELATKVQELTADASSNKEKIARLYALMQEQKRYVSVQLGIGGWQPFSADYVEEHGYGDCKALSNYMKAVLAEIGIESYPVIIQASGHHPYEVEDDFVDPAFNHAILYVPEEDMWLECTSSVNPAGYLGSFTNDRKVLLVTPEGGRLARTPKLGTAENTSAEHLVVALAADGSAVLHYEGVMQGIPHEKWRYYEFGYSEEEVKNKIREKGKLPTLNLNEVSVKAAPDMPTATVHFTAETERYASRAGKRLFVPLNLICPWQEVPDAVENRTRPVQVPYGYTKDAVIELQLPENYRVESLPKPLEISTPFGAYSLSVEETEGGVVVRRKLVLTDEEQPAEAYAEFREFLQQLVKADASKMVLVSE